ARITDRHYATQLRGQNLEPQERVICMEEEFRMMSSAGRALLDRMLSPASPGRDGMTLHVLLHIAGDKVRPARAGPGRHSDENVTEKHSKRTPALIYAQVT